MAVQFPHVLLLYVLVLIILLEVSINGANTHKEPQMLFGI